MDPLLLYSITTSPFPLQASAGSGKQDVAQLTIVATNNTGSDVTLQGIMIQIPIGEGSTQLTNDATDIQPVTPENWNNPQIQTPPGFIQYRYLPKQGYGTLGANQSLNFIFNSIQVNSQTGPVEIDITEGSNNCVPPNCPVKELSVTKFPNGWGEVSFWTTQPPSTNPSPPIISPGGSLALNWSGPAGAIYSIEYYTVQTGIVNVPAQGQPPLSNEGQYPGQSDPPLDLQQNTTFYLNVAETINGQTYNAEQNIPVTVIVPLPTITQFIGFFQQKNATLELILNWNTDADNCMISGDANLLSPTSTDNSYRISPSVQTPLLTRYTLTANNSAGKTISTLIVVWGTGNSMEVAYPTGVAVSPDAAMAYVVNQADATGTSQLIEVSASSFQLIGNSAGIGYTPQPVIISPDGTRIYIGNDAFQIGSGPPTVTVLDGTASPPVVLGQPVNAAGRPLFLAVTPDGSRLFVLNFGGNSLSAFATSSDRSAPLSFLKTIIVCDPGTYQAVSGLAISPDGKRIYVGTSVRNDYNSPWVSKIVVVDPISMTIIGSTVLTAGPPSLIAVSPDGSHVFVAVSTGNADDAVVVFTSAADPQNPLNQIGVYVSNGYMMALGASPDGSCVYVVSESRVTTGFLATVDVATCQAITTPATFTWIPQNFAVSADGSRIFLSGSNTFWMVVPISLAGGV